MKKPLAALLFFSLMLMVSSCDLDFDAAADETSTPTYSGSQAGFGSCTGPYTGITVPLPDEDWGCQVATNDDTAETITIDSSLFHIVITTIERAPYCQAAVKNPSCVQTPFYENNHVSLSVWSSDGVIKEIYGVTRVDIKGKGTYLSYSITYAGMDHRKLTTDEQQELIVFLDSITYRK